MTLTSYNGISIPSFMYGTAWKKEATSQLVQQAVAEGFTAIDTANQLIHYQEALVGAALLEIAKQGVTRESLFLQTKFTSVNGQDHRTPYDANADLTTQVNQSFQSSLSHLHTDYLDSYVLHGPYGRRGLSEADWEVWAAIESFYESGKSKMIGISNVSAEQLALLCAKARHKPMVVQNRCYAAFGWDKEVRDLCREHRIIYQGFSLLTANREVFTEPDVRAMAAKYCTGLAQIVFRFSQQVGMLPITGTTNQQHMAEDLTSDQFTLTTDEVALLETIGQ
ncbi:MAG: Putative 2,5-diketo-D-gluconic acid reductase [Nitrospira sp.]|nr:MAG: Putative 2,5-diketo-D-gluconic acid reductase [Nitrospira sp.]